MNTRSTASIHIQMPAGFPADIYKEVCDKSQRAILQARTDRWIEFNSSYTAVSWRYRAFTEHVESFLAIYLRLSNIEFIYETEKHLFGMYVNCVATVESLIYSLNALLSTIQSPNLDYPESDKKRGSFSEVLIERAGNIDGAEELKTAVFELQSSVTWQDSKNYRNRLSHRSNIPRRLQIGGPGPTVSLAETSNTKAGAFGPTEVGNLDQWLCHSTQSLLFGTLSYLNYLGSITPEKFGAE